MGYEIAVEESSSHGRLDMAVRAHGHVYLFEFKVERKWRRPGRRWRSCRSGTTRRSTGGGGEPIHLVGVEFSRATRNITAFETADA